MRINKFAILLGFLLFTVSAHATLTITKSVNRIAASLSSTLTYVIYVSNSGPGAVTGVSVWDTIPYRASYLNSNPSGSFSGSYYSWNPGTIAAGGAYSITLTVKVDDDINTTTANIMNTASASSNEEGTIRSMPVFTTIVRTFINSDLYVTYGGWVDRDSKSMGFVHIYTLADDTTVKLYESDNIAPATISTLNPICAGLGLDGLTSHAAGKVLDYNNANPALTFYDGDGDHSVGNGFSTKYFKLEANKPILWVFDSIVDDNWSDSYIFVMSTDYKFSGSTFYTHLNYDRNPYSSSDATSMKFGDGIAVININPFDIAAYVYRSTDNGASWYLSATNTVKQESPAHANGSAGGIWFYGGTTNTVEGDCKVVIRELDSSGNDVGDAKAILWKGNFFAGADRPSSDAQRRDSDHDNANAFGISQYGNKVSNLNSDVIYGCVGVSDDPTSGRGEMVITNMGAGTANVSIYKYNPDSSTYRDPVDSNGFTGDENFGNSGVWQTWAASVNIAAGASLTLYNGSSTAYGQGEHYGSFVKVVLNSGGPIEANGGANVHAALYGQADYLEATDTNISVGKDFYFGNSNWSGYGGDWWKKNAGGCFLAFCPLANTTVTVNGTLSPAVDIGYPGFTANVQTSTLDSQVLQFHSIQTGITYHITSDKPIFLMVQNLKGREKVFSGVSVAAVYLSPNPVLQKSSSAASVWAGDTFTYSLVFFNGGAGTAKNISIADTLPADVAFISSNPVPSNVSGSVYSWDYGSVAPGAAQTVRVVVRATGCGVNVTNTAITYYEDINNVPQPAVTSAANYVTINCIPSPTPSWTASPTQTMTPTRTGTPTVTVTMTPVYYPTIVLTKIVDVNPALPGSTVNYTINYSNTSAIMAASNVILYDDLWSKLTFVSATGGGVHNGVNPGGQVTWNIPSIPAGGSGSVSFAAVISVNMIKGEQIPNRAEAVFTPGTTLVQSNQVMLNMNIPDLQLTPVVNVPNPTVPGIDYTDIIFYVTVHSDITIRIYTLSGEPIRTIKNAEIEAGLQGATDVAAGNNRFRWNLKNDNNQTVSSGIYFYRVEATTPAGENAFYISKLAVLR